MLINGDLKKKKKKKLLIIYPIVCFHSFLDPFTSAGAEVGGHLTVSSYKMTLECTT